jgi:hypothetical protein
VVLEQVPKYIDFGWELKPFKKELSIGQYHHKTCNVGQEVKSRAFGKVALRLTKISR